jgi:hypothetical protein
MTTHIKTALALMTGVVLGGVGFGALRAQTKAQPAYWVTEVLEMRDQAAFMKAIQAVPPTVQNFGGRYIVLGGKLTADTDQCQSELPSLRSTAWTRRRDG